MSTSEDYFYDDWEPEQDDATEDQERRSKPRNRKKYIELKRRAEDRLAKRRLKDQLGYYDYGDLDGIDL